MNTYQYYAMKNINFIQENDKEKECLKKMKFENNKIILEQNENYNVKKYTIYMTYNNSKFYGLVKSIEYCFSGITNFATKINDEGFQIEVDFDNRIDNITIHINDEVVEPIIINVEFIEANKEVYDAKIQLQRKNELDKLVNVNVKTGDQLINVLFQPVSDKYSYSMIELYAINQLNEKQLMAKYKTDKEVYFYSITGLAYGQYAIIFAQYDCENNQIYKSDLIKTPINKPLINGRNVVKSAF